MRRAALWLWLGILWSGLSVAAAAEPKSPPTAQPIGPPSADTLVLAVLDPLALELACPCVEGYAQRNYHQLAKFLAKRTGRLVRVVFSESLDGVLKSPDSGGRADLIIGKQSVIDFELPLRQLQAQRVARLTDKQGKTIQTGLFVVPAADPAKQVADLAGYRLIFGPAECEEKHGAALALLAVAGVAAPADLESQGVCSDAAELILQLGPQHRAAAVISSYAQPLLEGCGKIKKGDLRVVGETEPVPFIAAYLSSSLAPPLRDQLTAELLSVGRDTALCQALESKAGFEPAERTAPRTAAPVDSAKKK
jgi:ABC-type phosphate/phosphonate transport system substrate-binding protein